MSSNRITPAISATIAVLGAVLIATIATAVFLAQRSRRRLKKLKEPEYNQLIFGIGKDFNNYEIKVKEEIYRRFEQVRFSLSSNLI
jgi:hypothetical protein